MDFADIAEGYEAWYTTPQGHRADALEKALLAKLLRRLPGLRSVLEVGSGTGHFTRWLAEEGLWTVGLDISSAMLAQAERLEATARGCSRVLGDGLALPFPDRSFDLLALITTLEFIPRPKQALVEAGRVASCGLLLGVLNRYSLLALRRHRGLHPGPTIYDCGRFFAVGELAQLARTALGTRLRELTWRTTLFPSPWPSTDARLPWGAFIGMLLELEREGNG